MLEQMVIQYQLACKQDHSYLDLQNAQNDTKGILGQYFGDFGGLRTGYLGSLEALSSV